MNHKLNGRDVEILDLEWRPDDYKYLVVHEAKFLDTSEPLSVSDLDSFTKENYLELIRDADANYTSYIHDELKDRAK